jgi:hypothetical protein
LQGKPVNTPDPGVYFRILKEHDVKALFVAPTALRAIRREVILSKIILFIRVIKELIFSSNPPPPLFFCYFPGKRTFGTLPSHVISALCYPYTVKLKLLGNKLLCLK